MRFKSIAISLFLLLFSFPIDNFLFAGYYEEACKNFTFKKYEKARELFLKNLEITDNGNSYYFLGEIEKAEGNYDKAEEYYKISISKNVIKKYKKLAYWNLIILQEQQGRYRDMVVQCKEFWEDMNEDSAKKKVETVINKLLWTNNEDAKNIYNSGIENKRNGSIEEAKKNFYSALQIDSNFLAAKFEIALIYLEDDNPNYAIQYLRDISDEIPFYGEVHLLLGDLYFNNHTYNYSIHYLNNAMKYGFLDRKTKYLIRLKLATSNYELRQYEQAITEISAAIELNNKEIEPLILLSAIYIKSEDFKNALETLLKARDRNKDNIEIIYQIGSLYYKTDDQQYLKYFDLLFNKIAGSKDKIPQKYYKAFILLLKKQYEKEKYQETCKIIEFLPEDMLTYDLHLMAARSLFHVGKYSKAIDHFEKISLENDDKFLLSISYAQNDEREKARNILWNLSEINGYLDKAKSENAVRKIAFDIENEKRRIEEERIKKLERLEQERLDKEQKAMENIISDEKDDIEPAENTVQDNTDKSGDVPYAAPEPDIEETSDQIQSDGKTETEEEITNPESIENGNTP
ncbi:MAG: hypothetical protein JW864_05510 [Spirochaetes bacterium]|nr:hypothetical protein [Spirochaetota bacterium]